MRYVGQVRSVSDCTDIYNSDLTYLIRYSLKPRAGRPRNWIEATDSLYHKAHAPCGASPASYIMGNAGKYEDEAMKAQKGIDIYLYSFFNLGARCGVWVINATPRQLYPQDKRDVKPHTEVWVGSRAGLDGGGKLRPPPGFEKVTNTDVSST